MGAQDPRGSRQRSALPSELPLRGLSALSRLGHPGLLDDAAYGGHSLRESYGGYSLYEFTGGYALYEVLRD